jgi:hypothetical protein
VRDRIATVGARTAYIEPGSPWENGSCESFNARLRDELLLALKADKLSAARSSTASARPGSSSRIGDGTTTRSGRTAPSAGYRQLPRSLPHSTSDPPCTNDQSGPLDAGRSDPPPTMPVARRYRSVGQTRCRPTPAGRLKQKAESRRPRPRAPRPHRLPSPGCWRRSPGSSRSRGRRSCIAWKTTRRGRSEAQRSQSRDLPRRRPRPHQRPPDHAARQAPALGTRRMR